MGIGLLLVSERLLPSAVPALAPAVPVWRIPAGLAFACVHRCVSTFLGVAGASC